MDAVAISAFFMCSTCPPITLSIPPETPLPIASGGCLQLQQAARTNTEHMIDVYFIMDIFGEQVS
jgi:hypothetical protein